MNREKFLAKYSFCVIQAKLKGNHEEKLALDTVIDICKNVNLSISNSYYSPRLSEDLILNISLTNGLKVNADALIFVPYPEFLTDYSDLKESEIEDYRRNNVSRFKRAAEICKDQNFQYEELKELEDFKTPSLYKEGWIQGYSSNTFSLWWKPEGERLLVVYKLGTFIIN